MAKTFSEDKGKVKFRFVEFELEGLNSTIEESIQNIVNSMSRGATPQFRAVSSTKPLIQGPAGAGENGHAETEFQPQDGEIEQDDSGEEVRSPSPKGPRHYTMPKFLSTLDLDSGNPSFKTFAEQQNPKSDNRKYIVIAAWLKKNRNIDVVSTDHIYTCNQKMGWKTQRDVGQPFRQLRKKSYFEAGGRNQWIITHVGLDQLNSAEVE
jgi:hypothetical protein